MTAARTLLKRFECVVYDAQGLGVAEQFDALKDAQEWAATFAAPSQRHIVDIHDRLGSKSRCYELKYDDRDRPDA